MVESLKRVEWLDLMELRWTMDVVRSVKRLELVKLLESLISASLVKKYRGRLSRPMQILTTHGPSAIVKV